MNRKNETGSKDEPKGMEKDTRPKRVYARPPLDMSDEELEAWAEEFVRAILATGPDIEAQSSKERDS